MADPWHCSKYWECYEGCLTHMTCQKNYLFDSVNGWCDFPENVCCEKKDCDGRKCNENCNQIGNEYSCPEKDGFFADEKNCMKYYQCSNNIATRIDCGKSKYFWFWTISVKFRFSKKATKFDLINHLDLTFMFLVCHPVMC